MFDIEFIKRSEHLKFKFRETAYNIVPIIGTYKNVLEIFLSIYNCNDN
jgi:hypothetical protein